MGGADGVVVVVVARGVRWVVVEVLLYSSLSAKVACMSVSAF